MAMLVDNNNANIYFPKFFIRKASIFFKAVTDSGDSEASFLLDGVIVYINKSILQRRYHIVLSRFELVEHIEYLRDLALITL